MFKVPVKHLTLHGRRFAVSKLAGIHKMAYGDEYYWVEHDVEGAENEYDTFHNDPVGPMDRPSAQDLGFNLHDRVLVEDAVDVVRPSGRYVDETGTRPVDRIGEGQEAEIIGFEVSPDGTPIPGSPSGAMLVRLPDGNLIVVFPDEVQKLGGVNIMDWMVPTDDGATLVPDVENVIRLYLENVAGAPINKVLHGDTRGSYNLYFASRVADSDAHHLRGMLEAQFPSLQAQVGHDGEAGYYLSIYASKPIP